MDAARLLALIAVLDTEVKDGYLTALNELQQLYNQAQGNPQQDNSAAIQAKYEELASLLKASPINELVPSRVHMMKEIGAEGLFGEAALEAIDRAISARGGIAAVVTALKEFRDRLNQFQQHMDQVWNGFKGLGVAPAHLKKDEYELGVILPPSLTDSQLSGFIKVLEDWNFILRTFGEVAGAESREIEVRDVASGSPLIEIFANISLAEAVLFLTALEKISLLYKEIRDIHGHRTKLEKLGVPPPDAETARAHEEKLINEGLKETRDELMKHGKVKGDAGRKAELKNGLTKALRDLADFIDHDVDVEIALPDQLPEPEIDEKELLDKERKKLTGDALAQRKKKLAAEKRRQMRATGAVVATLPARDKPILQLPEPETAKGSKKEEGGGKKKGN